MTNRLLKIALPAFAALGVLAAAVPAEARCWWDGYGNRVCSRPAPPVYVAPPAVYFGGSFGPSYRGPSYRGHGGYRGGPRHWR